MINNKDDGNDMFEPVLVVNPQPASRLMVPSGRALCLPASLPESQLPLSGLL